MKLAHMVHYFVRLSALILYDVLKMSQIIIFNVRESKQIYCLHIYLAVYKQ